MPGEDIQSWSIVAANNSNSDTSINWAEGQPRASVNNSARSMMASHAKDRNLRNGSIVTGGAANAQTFVSGVTYTSVPAGLRVLLKIGVANTGATTLNMDGIGDVEIKKKTTGHPSLVAGDLVLFGYYEFLHDGTNWLLFDAVTEADLNGKVDMAGDTMTGNLTVPNLVTSGVVSTVNVTISGAIVGNCLITGNTSISGSMQTNGIISHAGLNGGYGANVYNFFWTGSSLTGYADTLNLGAVTFSSDYRIKKDVEDLPRMWEAVKALRPIKYTQAEYPRSEMSSLNAPMFEADDIERWGFVAHELQETLTESAATGVKDQEDMIQSPNPFTLIAALTKALQEAMERIEALEER